ncbi:response regulator transcription factor [Parvularcula sp. ZS-1/3]|uniref:Regulatory protein VirG n=1 Tax=Parvularcula mediterranea TaxID=2732508 RepID=A0A7Y3RND4_9PROT|nr:response regulator transcription factor [Parvularcula mediterranea]NNU17264.1 response regulator transcription factor [Parvularcula mediterranea]
MNDVSAARTRVLLVDDEPTIREPLAAFLRRECFDVEEAHDAAKARELVAAGRFDIALLDVMMPGEDGLSLARYLVGSQNLPVIMLTARTEETDRIIGLELGADDYVAKPFSPRELTARIKAVLRRGARATPESEPEAMTFDDLTLELTTQRLIGRDGAEITLTGGEFKLLHVLAERAGRVVNRDDLLELTQNRRADVFDRSVDNQVSRLRKKVEREPSEPALIKTIRGGGYSLAAKVRTR